MSILNARRRFGRIATGALAVLAAFHVVAAEEGFTSLFDGQSLRGWEGNTSIWSVRDGAITGETKADTNLRHNTFLVWQDGTVGDFELRLKYRIVNGNSGIQYRSRVVEQGPQGPIVAGYQADFEAGKTYSGILYEERGRGILAQRGQVTRISPGPDNKPKIEVIATVGKSEDIQTAIKSEDWNDYIINARGNRLTHIINGRVTADVIDEDSARAARTGVLAFQVHTGPPMTVQFKDIRLKDLSTEGKAQAATDFDLLQGQWEGVSGIFNGQPIPSEAATAIVLTFDRDRYEASWADGEDSGRFKLIETARPRRIEVESSKNGPVRGIYEISGKRLRIAYASADGKLPEDFDTAALAITYARKE